jgi:hypothetical protein
VKFDLKDEYAKGMGYFSHDFKSMTIKGSNKPWLFSSGCLGFSKCEIPLIDDIFGEPEAVYTVRLGFKAMPEDRSGRRVFDILLQGEMAEKDFDIYKEAGSAQNVVIREYKGIHVKNILSLELVSVKADPAAGEAPVISFMEVVREGFTGPAEFPESETIISETEAETLLEKAGSDLDQNHFEAALEKYHRVLDGATTQDHKLRALDGMALIASPQSLPRLTDYCRDVTPMPKGFKEYTRHLDLISFGRYLALDPNRKSTPKRKVESIVWDYDEPGPELITSGLRVFIAIAHNIAGNDREKAIRMLNYALDYANEDLRIEIVSSLNDLGAEVTDAKSI